MVRFWKKALFSLLCIVLFSFIAGCHEQTPALTAALIPSCVVPDVHALSVDQAEKTLTAAGFRVTISEVTSDSVDAGTVITTQPEPGTALSSCNTEILLLVSKGSIASQNPWNGWNEGIVYLADQSGSLELQKRESLYRWQPLPESGPIYHYELYQEALLQGNLSVSVQAKRESGEDGSAAGLVLYFADRNQYLLFSLFDVGYFSLDNVVDGVRENIVNPRHISYTYTGKVNRLKVNRLGSQYDFYVNTNLVYTWQDPQNKAYPVQVGLAVRLKDSATVFSFENIRITQTDVESTAQKLDIIPLRAFDFNERVPAEISFNAYKGGVAETRAVDGVYQWQLRNTNDARYRATCNSSAFEMPQDGLSIALTAERVAGMHNGCSYGIVYNYLPLTGYFQVANIRDDNYCEVYQYNSISQLKDVLAGKQNCYVLSGKPNHLQVNLTSDTVAVYVNGYTVFNLSGSQNNLLEGSVGIQVDCSPGENTFNFDDFNLYQISGGTP